MVSPGGKVPTMSEKTVASTKSAFVFFVCFFQYASLSALDRMFLTNFMKELWCRVQSV